MSEQPVFLTWLWNPRGGWRDGAGYTPEIIQGVQHMLRQAIPEARHICICDEEYRVEMIQRGIEWWPLWETHGKGRTSRHGFDCHARLGLWGLPGLEMAEVLGIHTVQWLDADVMIRPTAREALLERWEEVPEMFWLPRARRALDMRCTFGKNTGTWLGINCSMARLQLGSRPHWWQQLADEAWLEETEAHICGSDQAAITRLLLEELGQEWRAPNHAIFEVPHFGDKVVAYGAANRWEVAFFPYDPFTEDGRLADFTKPWLTRNAYLNREWRVLAGLATDAEMRAQASPGLRRSLGRP